MSFNRLTQRYVFVVEYSCSPLGDREQQRSCHGWVHYQPKVTAKKLSEPFSELDLVGEVISQMVLKLDSEPDSRNR